MLKYALIKENRAWARVLEMKFRYDLDSYIQNTPEFLYLGKASENTN